MKSYEGLYELRWANIYHDTIINSEWFLEKTVSPGGDGRWAVGYNFLYALYRILDEMHPRNIFELGLGQSTKMTGQYARYFGAGHTVVEHDRDWVDFFCNGWKNRTQQTKIYLSELIEIHNEKENKCVAYKRFDEIVNSLNAKCELILVDGPFGGDGDYSRRDIVSYLPRILSDEFVIMVDDCGRRGEMKLLGDIANILSQNNIEYAVGVYKSDGDCSTGVIACKKWRFFTSM